MTTYPNGQYPDSALADTHIFHYTSMDPLQTSKEVKEHADAMALAFALWFHRPLTGTDGYRSLEDQIRLYQPPPIGKGPGFAAPPGTSNHGWAKAIDFASGINSFTSAEHKWMKENASRFGFAHPYWARDGGGREEPWHWEWVGGGSGGPRILPAAPGEMGLGWKGDVVRAYQGLLNDKGDIHIVEDGDYGFMTAVAVAAIQKRVGIPVTGRMTPATKRYLNDTPKEEDDMPTAQEIAKETWSYKSRVPSNLVKYLGKTATMRAIVNATALRTEEGRLSDDEIIRELRELDADLPEGS